VETEHVLNEAGEFAVTDEPIDLSHYRFEDWAAFALFWVLATVIFYQFFTRYALNDSAAWTEEISRYLLICTVFVGASSSVRKNTHIHVDLFYRFMPASEGIHWLVPYQDLLEHIQLQPARIVPLMSKAETAAVSWSVSGRIAPAILLN
jgi:TRAP-type mannitol/chloroaromatic compound transport system permease small subunit